MYTFSQNFWCAHFCAPFGQNMCAFVRFFEKFWCAHFCAPFGQSMCAFEFRIIGHSGHMKTKIIADGKNILKMAKSRKFPGDIHKFFIIWKILKECVFDSLGSVPLMIIDPSLASRVKMNWYLLYASQVILGRVNTHPSHK